MLVKTGWCGGKGFRDLRVGQCGMEFGGRGVSAHKGFPRKSFYGLTNQLRRAAVSIPSNIAEGQTRSHVKEFLQFLSTAQGSLAEVQTQIELAGRLKYLSVEQLEPALQHAESLAKQLYALRNSLADGK